MNHNFRHYLIYSKSGLGYLQPIRNLAGCSGAFRLTKIQQCSETTNHRMKREWYLRDFSSGGFAMPDVCVDNGAVNERRFRNLMQELGWTREQTLGSLCCLWLDTQEVKLVKASKEAILKFVEERVFDAMVRTGYISQVDLEFFEIRGNAQRLKKKCSTKPKKLNGESVELVAAYQEEYIKQFGKEPPTPAPKERAQLVSLVPKFGKDIAIQVVRHYFNMGDGYYKANFYPIGLLLKQSHKIYGHMTTGQDFSRAKILRMEKTRDMRQTLQDIEQGVI